ncbi:PKD domain-containing protein [Hymenobacter rubidus]|uniref:PKD domain-containing protein n=1 Tax=Hymenobacter rubidus TaxID=1441626 RepID=UPI00191D9BCB|nr:PKD domain-containing protein [Hymenobacter rubidus]
MKKLFLLLMLGSLVSIYADAQPSLTWQRIYRKRQLDTYLSVSFGYRISSARYVLGGRLVVPDPTVTPGTGLRSSPGLLFLNAAGDSIGSRFHTLRGLSPSAPNASIRDICRTPAGGIAATGWMLDSVDHYSNFFYTCDTLGSRLTPFRYFNVHSYGSASDSKMLPLPDGYLVLVGTTTSPAQVSAVTHQLGAVFKLDLQGNVVWQRLFPEVDLLINDIVPRPDGSYALIGNRLFYRQGQASPVHVWVGGVTATGDTLPGRLYPGLHGTDYTFANAAALTPDGGLLLAGYSKGQGLTAGSTLFNQGLLVKLDAQGTVQQTRTIVSPAWGASYSDAGSRLFRLSVLSNGDALAFGYYSTITGITTSAFSSFLGGFAAVTLQPSFQLLDSPLTGSYPTLLHEANGQLRVQGGYASSNRNGGTLVRAYQNAGVPYQPNLCATPPVPNAGYAFNAARDTLRLADFSTGGGIYAVVSAWHWSFGDGSTYDGRTPPPHRYNAPPTAATPVTLTVTNNLGCSATQMLFPFALSTAAQRELAARVQLFPSPVASGGAVTVQWPGLQPSPVEVRGELLDALGRVARHLAWPVATISQGVALDIAGLGAGLYMLRLQAAEGTATRRLEVR